MLSRFEIQTHHLDAIVNDIQRTITQELLGSDDVWKYLDTQQPLVVQTCLKYGRELVKVLDGPAHKVMVNKAREKMPVLGLYLELYMQDEGRFIEDLLIDDVLEGEMRGRRRCRDVIWGLLLCFWKDVTATLS
jgi:hypothetical protein